MVANYPFFHQRSLKKDQILVVDDVPDNCFLIQSILEEEGYQITVAYSGPEAITLIEESPPDLLLLDLMMPGMDGYEITRQLRSRPGLPFLPILLVTASEDASMVKGLDLGADDFIRKPVAFDVLLAKVRSLLRLKHSVDERDHIASVREDFVSRLTHDLRTPLVAADRMFHLFEQGAFGDLPPQMQEAIKTMLISNQNLLKMVNQLLEVYRYEAGRKPLAFSSLDLEELLTQILQELKGLAQEKSLELYLDRSKIEPKQAVKIKGDRVELHRVFTNLIGNAIKFTDRGFVKICLRVEKYSLTDPDHGSVDENSEVIIEVHDTGCGISPQEQANLFERFRTGNHTRAGSGLGLYLSRQIVEAHCGKLELKSELEVGSVFAVHLPTNPT